MTPDLLRQATGCSPLNLSVVAAALNDAMPRWGITTPLRQAHFLAQIAFESGGFQHVEENLNYSAERLAVVFHRYFFLPPALALGRRDASEFARNPEKIGNLVYANRMGNGAPESGDGYRFRGRAWIEITGKDAYIACNEALPTVPCVSIPEALCVPENAALASAWFFATHGCLEAADADSVPRVSSKVNGGDPARPAETINGYSGRVAATVRAKMALGVRL